MQGGMTLPKDGTRAEGTKRNKCVNKLTKAMASMPRSSSTMTNLSKQGTKGSTQIDLSSEDEGWPMQDCDEYILVT
ncbi:hypothetical protein HPP92_010218 [Vanilla planifolia]|uniref:Uncharacterized protein n=1 Tax=Vanilla planifolia TaxID=51239 RepID=A0A835QTG9_VANPL|nr:hypothetical protein HPP92_010218 [Vanilla planifolia]